MKILVKIDGVIVAEGDTDNSLKFDNIPSHYEIKIGNVIFEFETEQKAIEFGESLQIPFKIGTVYSSNF